MLSSANSVGQFSHRCRRSLAVALGLLLGSSGVLVPGLSGQAQTNPVSQARITEILNGNQVYIQNRQAAVNAIATRNQQVRTGRSRAELRFNTGAVGRLAQNTSLVVGQDCVRVRRGQLLVNGPGRGCTNQTVLGVRGTTYTLAVDEAGSATVTVLEGSMELTLVDPSLTDQSALNQRIKHDSDTASYPSCTLKQESTPVVSCAPLPITEGLRVTVDPEGQLQAIQPLTQAEFTAILTGPLMANYTNPLPGQDQLRESFQGLYPGVLFPDIPGPMPDPDSPQAQASCDVTVANYRREVEDLVDSNWTPPPPPAPGFWLAVVTYDIDQDGEVEDLTVSQPSGDAGYDQSAIDSILSAAIPPPPACYPDALLEINHRFQLDYF
ncbi:MAG: TonB C-terminal domain-containing protein [Cyanobacteria bacterium J06635_15]